MDLRLICFLIADILLVLILFKWIINQIRNICEKIEGFIKFVQIMFIGFSWFVFLSMFVYYLIWNPEKETQILTVFLTIVVGFLGTVMGLFFSTEALNELRIKYQKRTDRMKNIRKTLENTKKTLEKFKRELKN